MNVELPVLIERQPDYTTCGPTALHAVYRYFNDPIDLATVIKETPKLPGGGTLSVHLSVHALRRGYEVDTWMCNVRHMDPTWFQQPTDILAKLKARVAAKKLGDDPRYGPAIQAVEEYITLGGKVRWGDITPKWLGGRLAQGTPLLTGTNGTYLYQCARETEAGPDDVRGDAFGHFIVICGYNDDDESVAVADPLLDNPAHGTKYYRASVYRLLGAIFLGVGSDDGNLVLIRPKGWKGPAGANA
ncbi:MAG TPA: peptidase-C39 like family protein [Gammaproteobacteria bacterium]|nr:peptidase-C39 like family protein [Gammaproteobacteria bacterium]